MCKTLLIIRGIPGGGKSTLAATLKADLVCSEDDYWTRKDGSYDFHAETREDAFRVMFETARIGIWTSARRIVIATAALSITTKDWTALIKSARWNGYAVFSLILQRPTRNPPSIHNVTAAEMFRFRSEMEHGLEVTI